MKTYKIAIEFSDHTTIVKSLVCVSLEDAIATAKEWAEAESDNKHWDAIFEVGNPGNSAFVDFYASKVSGEK